MNQKLLFIRKKLVFDLIVLLAAYFYITQLSAIGRTSSDFDKNKENASFLPAFPGAEGYGAIAVGGRAGKIIEVTNLNDSGLGSLRSALKSDGPRIVVFRVAGIIELKDAIRINKENSFLTIAGQTAPGGGITLKGINNNILQIQKGAHDIIIRYIKLRNGSGTADGSGYDNLTINGGFNIIVDHVSMSWSTDENVSLYRKVGDTPIYNITIQWSIMAEGLAGHSNGMLISGRADYSDPDNPIEEWRKIYNVSIHHNLFIHNSDRNPRITAGGVQIINNVIYNWKHRIGSSTRGSIYDNICNYAKAGPMSNLNSAYLHENFSPMYITEKYPDPSIFTFGNIVESLHNNPDGDDWDLYKLNYLFTSLPRKYRRYIPLPEISVAIKKQSAYEAFESVIADVGANARLDCNGNWIKNHDAVDTRLLSDVKYNTGPEKPIKRIDSVGGYPVIDPGKNYLDSDRDGMPDEWEISHGFNQNDPSDASEDGDGDGYTNIEEFLNGPHD